RGADVAGRPDALRRGQGERQHQGGPGVRGAGDDRGAPDRPSDPVTDPFPSRLEPMKATLAKGLPERDELYGYEFKWDGVRALSYVKDGHVCIQSRNLLDVTAQYPELTRVGEALAGRTAVLDGEIVALDEQGRPSLQRLQRRRHLASRAGVRRLMRQFPVASLVFDVLRIDGC